MWEEACKSNFNTFNASKAAETFFLLIHGGLHCEVNHRKWFRKKNYEAGCHFCKQEETCAHVFLCPQWSKVWEKVTQLLAPCVPHGVSTRELVTGTFSSNKKRLCNTVIFSTLQQIWKARCVKVHEKRDTNDNEIIIRIKHKIKESIRHSSRRLSAAPRPNSHEVFVPIANKDLDELKFDRLDEYLKTQYDISTL